MRPWKGCGEAHSPGEYKGMSLDYEVIDDLTRADVAVRVKGSSYDELFIKGGRALLCEMLENHGDISGEVEKSGTLSAAGLDLLFFEFLNEIIFFKDAESLLLLPEAVNITAGDGGYSCVFKLKGETIDRDRHIFRADIKAVTMHGLRVFENEGVYIAEALFDV